MFGFNLSTVGKARRDAEDVLQLADVAWPVVRKQPSPRVTRQTKC